VSLVIIGALWWTSVAPALQRVRLEAAFSPDRLNAPTTLIFGFEVFSPGGETPSPLRTMQLFLPAGMGLATSTLGLANCDPSALLLSGPAGCSPNARMGSGIAEAVVPISPEKVLEKAKVVAMAGPVNPEHLELLFYTEAISPVAAQLVFPGRLEIALPKGRYGGSIDATIPLVPTWQGGPFVSLTRLRSTLGPAGLVYTRHLHGRTVHFHPRGITIPSGCPPGGFPLAATLSFLDGTSTTSRIAIPCPGGPVTKAEELAQA
jgi:hypothetical protein